MKAKYLKNDDRKFTYIIYHLGAIAIQYLKWFKASSHSTRERVLEILSPLTCFT